MAMLSWVLNEMSATPLRLGRMDGTEISGTWPMPGT